MFVSTLFYDIKKDYKTVFFWGRGENRFLTSSFPNDEHLPAFGFIKYNVQQTLRHDERFYESNKTLISSVLLSMLFFIFYFLLPVYLQHNNRRASRNVALSDGTMITDSEPRQVRYCRRRCNPDPCARSFNVPRERD